MQSKLTFTQWLKVLALEKNIMYIINRIKNPPVFEEGGFNPQPFNMLSNGEFVIRRPDKIFKV